LTNNDLFNLGFTQNFLDELTKGLEGRFLLFELLLFLLSLFEIKTFLGTVLELLTIILLKLLDDVLIDGVNHIEDLDTSLLEGLDEGRGSNGGSALTSNEVDILLTFLHSGNVLLEGCNFFTRLGRVVSEEIGELGSVGGIFVDTELKILTELFVELLIVFSILGDFSNKFNTLLGNILLYNLQDLIVLKEFSADVKGKIFRINNTLDESKIFGNQLLTIVHDENSSNVQLDVVLFLLGFEEIEGGSLGNKEDALEFQLTFNGELLNSQVLFPIVTKTLIEINILFLGNSFGFSHPNGLILINILILSGNFLYLLLFLVLLLILLFLDFNIFFTFLLLLFFGLFFIIGNFLFGGLFNL